MVMPWLSLIMPCLCINSSVCLSRSSRRSAGICTDNTKSSASCCTNSPIRVSTITSFWRTPLVFVIRNGKRHRPILRRSSALFCRFSQLSLWGFLKRTFKRLLPTSRIWKLPLLFVRSAALSSASDCIRSLISAGLVSKPTSCIWWQTALNERFCQIPWSASGISFFKICQSFSSQAITCARRLSAGFMLSVRKMIVICVSLVRIPNSSSFFRWPRNSVKLHAVACTKSSVLKGASSGALNTISAMVW